jgi:hypothetical protein
MMIGCPGGRAWRRVISIIFSPPKNAPVLARNCLSGTALLHHPRSPSHSHSIPPSASPSPVPSPPPSFCRPPAAAAPCPPPQLDYALAAGPIVASAADRPFTFAPEICAFIRPGPAVSARSLPALSSLRVPISRWPPSLQPTAAPHPARADNYHHLIPRSTNSHNLPTSTPHNQGSCAVVRTRLNMESTT